MKDKDQLIKIKYLIIDVDGTLTDAGIYYDEKGNELKKFCTKDAAGFFAAHQAGIRYSTCISCMRLAVAAHSLPVRTRILIPA